MKRRVNRRQSIWMITASIFAAALFPVSAKGQSQWETSGTNIYYNAGNVGIGTTNPFARFAVYAAPSTTVPLFQLASTSSLANNDILRVQINGLTNGLRMFQDGSSNVIYSFEGGNVGIGTTSPVSKLDFGTSVANAKLIIGTYTAGNVWTGIGMGALSAGIRIAGDSASSNLLDVGSYSNDASHNWTSTMLVGSGGVGIGTTSPVSKLDFGTSAANAKLIIGTYTAGNVWTGIGMGALSAGIRIAGDSASNNLLDVGSYSNDASHNWTSTMFVGSSGVGIGTTSPQTALSIYNGPSNYINIGPYGSGGFNAVWLNGSTALGSYNFLSRALDGHLYINRPSGADINFSENNASNDITIKSGGNVGIGLSDPGTYKLNVNGKTKVTGNLNIAAGNGEPGNIVAAGTIFAKYQDVAEWVPSSEQLAAGTVVVLDSTKSNHVASSSQSYDPRVAGVISAQPGIALGEKGDNKVLVATTGRVKVKVDASKGPIHIGDLLVTSDVPGVAMKSEPVELAGRKMHMPGTLIGKALEPLEKGAGEILVLLSLQ